MMKGWNLEKTAHTKDKLFFALMTYDEIMNIHKNIKRNDPCPCGSEKKFKRCHLDAFEKEYVIRLKQVRLK